MRKYCKYDHSLTEKYVDWAYTKLVGIEHTQVIKILNNEHNRLMDIAKKNNDFTDRNDFIKVMNCIEYEIDYGFSVGEEVEYWYSPHTKRTGKILEISDKKQVTFSDVIVPITWLEKIEFESEQLTIENFI